MSGLKRVRVVNMTGHPLRLGQSEDNNLRFRSEGRIRLDTHFRELEKVVVEGEDGNVTVPILSISGDEASLPDPEDGVLYVVSGLVGSRVRRADVVSLARLYKDDTGRVKLARALLRYP